jgi:hypothetical protein
MSLRVWWLKVLKMDSSKLSFGDSLYKAIPNYLLVDVSFKLISQKILTKNKLTKHGTLDNISFLALRMNAEKANLSLFS